MLKTLFYSLPVLVHKILFLPLENKIHIFMLHYNIPYGYSSSVVRSHLVVKIVVPRMPDMQLDTENNY